MHVERAFAFCNLREKEDVKDTGTVIIKYMTTFSIRNNEFVCTEWMT